MTTDRRATIAAAATRSRGGPSRIVIATAVAVVAIIATVIGVIWTTSTDSTPAAGQATPTTLLAGTQAIWANPQAPIAPGAPLVEVYEDFQCGHCHDLEQTVGATLRELGEAGAVRLGYHLMSFLDEQAGNTASRRAATGAVCAADAGSFQAFHDGVFATRPADARAGWSDEELTQIATAAAISGDALTTWKACPKNQPYAAYLDDRSSAPWKTPTFGGTPTIAINGTIIPTSQIATPAGLRAAVAAATT